MHLRQLIASTLTGAIWFSSFILPARDAYAQNFLPTPDQLDQLLAPVALYPDALLAQICAASTDPQQILDVDNWVRQNSRLVGQARTDAAQQQGFDPAFIALVSFPQVLDMMAHNIDDFAAMPEPERNMVRWMFLDPKARRIYPDWPQVAAQMVAILRVAGGRHMADARHAELVTELSQASEEFACAWADRNLFQHTHGPKRFHHNAIGTITLNYETLHLPADPGLSLILYTAAAGSPKICCAARALKITTAAPPAASLASNRRPATSGMSSPMKNAVVTSCALIRGTFGESSAPVLTVTGGPLFNGGDVLAATAETPGIARRRSSS